MKMSLFEKEFFLCQRHTVTDHMLTQHLTAETKGSQRKRVLKRVRGMIL